MTVNVVAGSDILAVVVTGGGGGGPHLVVTWGDVAAQLESATNVLEPWAPATGATSPYPVDPSDPARFFRLLLP